MVAVSKLEEPDKHDHGAHVACRWRRWRRRRCIALEQHTNDALINYGISAAVVRCKKVENHEVGLEGQVRSRAR